MALAAASTEVETSEVAAAIVEVENDEAVVLVLVADVTGAALATAIVEDAAEEDDAKLVEVAETLAVVNEPCWLLDDPELNEPLPATTHCRLMFCSRRSLVRVMVFLALDTSRLKTPGRKHVRYPERASCQDQ